MTRSSAATPRNKPEVCGLHSLNGLGPLDSNCIPIRRRSSTARTICVEVRRSTLTFLCYDFQGRSMLAKGRLFIGFNPALSKSAIKAKGKQIRDWHLNRRSGSDLSDLAEDVNPQVRGWIGYYGAFYRSKLSLIARRIDQHLVRWAMQKYKRLRGRTLKARAWLGAVR